MSKESESKLPHDGKTAFVISPIGAQRTETHKKSHYALKYIYKEALESEGWTVHRADDGDSPDSINHHVVKSVHEADLIIADLTGHNPNVFYELAIAHGFKKPVVHLISEGESMPFDIVDQRTIFYDITDLESVERTKETLIRYANHALENSDELITPLTSYENFNRIDSSLSDTQNGGAIVAALEEISSRLSRLERSYSSRPALLSERYEDYISLGRPAKIKSPYTGTILGESIDIDGSLLSGEILKQKSQDVENDNEN